MKERCPHCRTDADVEGAGDGSYRCVICGGPRIVVDDPTIERSGREDTPLKHAQATRLRRAVWATAAGVVGAFGLAGLLVTLGVLALVSPGLFATVATLFVVAIPLALAALAWSRVRHLSARMRDDVAEAERIVVSDVLESKGTELTAEQLAGILHTTEHHAELLLAQLAVEDFVHRRVTDHGDLAYAPTKNVRVVDEALLGDDGEPSEATDQSGARDEREKRARSTGES